MSATVEERLWSKVNKTEGCWNWTGAMDGQRQYGAMRINRRHAMPHRVSYELTKGPIPEGMVIDHICHNKVCVRPSHLRVATRKQNRENLGGAYANSSSGVRGVCFNTKSRKWQVYLTHNGKRHHGGLFADLEEAKAVAVEFRNSFFTHNDADRKAA